MVGLLFGALVALFVAQTSVGAIVGFDESGLGGDGNVTGVAHLVFGRYVLAFEATSALLITAALGAMVLAHRERLTDKATQRDTAARRMRDYAETGKHPGPLPVPGVYARHNAVDTPALLPDGSPSQLSLSRSLAARGNVTPAAVGDVGRTLEQLRGDDVGLDKSTHDPSQVRAGEDV